MYKELYESTKDLIFADSLLIVSDIQGASLILGFHDKLLFIMILNKQSQYLFFLFVRYILCCFVCRTEAAEQSYWKPRKQTNCKNVLVNIETLLNNKKIHRIPPLFHQNKYLADFKKKAELFNCLSAKQCSLINNSSELPLNLCKKTDNSLFQQSLSLVMIWHH